MKIRHAAMSGLLGRSHRRKAPLALWALFG